MKLNFRQLEAFKAVIETGTVSQAAEVLHVSQPAVSKLIANFERAVGFSAFDRVRGRLRPSPEGAMLYREIERAFVGIRQISQAAQDIRELKHGRLLLGVMPALTNGFIQEVTTAFLAERPQVSVTMHARSSLKVIEWLAVQQLDLGVIVGGLDHPGVQAEFLCRVEAVCVLPPNHRLVEREVIEPPDLEGESFISLTTLDQIRPRIDHPFQEANVRRVLRIDTPMAGSACAFVAKGAGVSIVDPFTAHEFLSAPIVVKPFRPAIHLDFDVCFPLSARRSHLTVEFARLLRETIANHPALPVTEMALSA
jgi:DNA-binding transcriptional LysR family regulator